MSGVVLQKAAATKFDRGASNRHGISTIRKERTEGSSPLPGHGNVRRGNEFFRAWGETDVKEATRLIEVCLEAGVNFFDTANVYSQGLSEEILGEAIRQVPRETILISSKGTFPSARPEQHGVVEASFDPADRGELEAPEDGLHRRLSYAWLRRADASRKHSPLWTRRCGKARCAISRRRISPAGTCKSRWRQCPIWWARYVGHQVYYSLVGRDYEWELMPQALSEGIGALVWSPLGWGRLTGKIRRGQPLPEGAACTRPRNGPPVPDEYLYKVVDVLGRSAETGTQRAATGFELGAAKADHLQRDHRGAQ